MPDPVLETVTRIIAEKALLNPADIDPDQELDALGLDSLAMVESIFAIEETYNIHIPFNANSGPDARPEYATVASVTAEVKRLLAETRP